MKKTLIEQILQGGNVRHLVLEKLYSQNEIQDIITKLKKNPGLFDEFCVELVNVNFADRKAILNVIRSGWYETFDRYNSDVCETFLNKWESLQARLKK